VETVIDNPEGCDPIIISPSLPSVETIHFNLRSRSQVPDQSLFQESFARKNRNQEKDW